MSSPLRVCLPNFSFVIVFIFIVYILFLFYFVNVLEHVKKNSRRGEAGRPSDASRTGGAEPSRALQSPPDIVASMCSGED